MQTGLTHDQLKTLIMAELPEIMKADPGMRRFVIDITKDRYADREKTEDRIDRILDELKQDREENRRKWEENQKKWEENQKKWEENQSVINEMLASVKALNKKHESSIGALGSRWGIQSEKAFRDGLKSILEESFHVKVEQYLDYDEEGEVFGRPDQVELDVIIYNGSLILCEIKSSMSKSDMYAFWRKTKFYEKKHTRKADRRIVISPMPDIRAVPTAQKLGIEVFGYADDVNL
jgi:hypothetical protein